MQSREGFDIVSAPRCNSVCLMLGPYRNLSTLTAATLFLHPQCQVLNHAGDRVFGGEYDFFSDCSSRGIDRFIRGAIEMSAGGERGDHGGSITLSHAFDPPHRMRALFERSGLPLVKHDIRSLLWKESHRTANLIRDRGVDLAGLLAADTRLRFLLPIRHPLDCAVSNIKTQHVRHFKSVVDPTDVGEVCEAVLDEIRWVMDLAERFPGRFFHFYEHSIGDRKLVDLETFLELDHDERWLALAREAMSPSSRHEHPAALVDRYRAAVQARFADYPETTAKLLAFVAPA